jgi:uncharacterized protein (DUF2249 family)
MGVDRMTANMTDRPGAGVMIASRAADAEAVQAVERHHAQLAGALSTHVEVLLAAVAAIAGSGGSAVEGARDRLVGFCAGELLPHAAAEEASLYPAAADLATARLLVESMVAEHRVLEALVGQVRTTVSPVRLAGAGNALRVLFDVHLAKENQLILPLVASAPNVSLAQILAGMHELLGEAANRGVPADAGVAGDTGAATGGCGSACGGGGGGDLAEAAPVLDVRTVPHDIRHATVFGAVGAIAVGGSLILVAPHDPVPLLGQLEDREPGVIAVQYEQRGPQVWQLRLTRER